MDIYAVFPSRYAKAHDLKGKPVTVTIQRVVLEEMGQPGKKEQKPVVYFRNATKGLILNKTNGMAIAHLYGPETDNWIGKRITIHPAIVRAFGAEHEVIRVRDQAPPAARPQQVEEEEAPEGLNEPEDVDNDNPFDDPAAGMGGRESA